MAELTGVGLSETSVEGVEHPRQLQGAQRRLELVAAGHDADLARRGRTGRAGPCRCAGAAGVGRRVDGLMVSVPAARIPFTVR